MLFPVLTTVNKEATRILVPLPLSSLSLTHIHTLAESKSQCMLIYNQLPGVLQSDGIIPTVMTRGIFSYFMVSPTFGVVSLFSILMDSVILKVLRFHGDCGFVG